MKYLRWSIWRADFDPVIGSEQGRARPVLIISDENINQILPVVNVIPITSRKSGRRIYPNEVLIEGGKYGLHNDSIALCFQIRTLDKRRLTLEYGLVSDDVKQKEIIEALCFQLGIER